MVSPRDAPGTPFGRTRDGRGHGPVGRGDVAGAQELQDPAAAGRVTPRALAQVADDPLDQAAGVLGRLAVPDAHDHEASGAGGRLLERFLNDGLDLGGSCVPLRLAVQPGLKGRPDQDDGLGPAAAALVAAVPEKGELRGRQPAGPAGRRRSRPGN